MDRPIPSSTLAKQAASPVARRGLSRLFCPESVYPALLLAWGMVLAFLLPPLQAPEERYHALRSFHLARGQMQPAVTRDDLLRGRAPAELLDLMPPRSMGAAAQPQLAANKHKRV